MNKVELVGRLTDDPELRDSSGTSVTRFGVAVQRTYKNSEGNYEADFPNCVAFGKTAEFVNQYFSKGKMIGIVGHIQTSKYQNKDGNTVYTTDVVIENVEFVGGKNDSDSYDSSSKSSGNSKDVDDGFMNIDDGIDEELPFN